MGHSLIDANKAFREWLREVKFCLFLTIVWVINAVLFQSIWGSDSSSLVRVFSVISGYAATFFASGYFFSVVTMWAHRRILDLEE